MAGDEFGPEILKKAKPSGDADASNRLREVFISTEGAAPADRAHTGDSARVISKPGETSAASTERAPYAFDFATFAQQFSKTMAPYIKALGITDPNDVAAFVAARRNPEFDRDPEGALAQTENLKRLHALIVQSIQPV